MRARIVNMEFIVSALDVVLHLERYLDVWALQYGLWMYAILFAVIFAETGLVITPFLPGDSLLFAVGAIAARGVLSLPVILIGLSVAAILGDMLNYAVGKFFGHIVTAKFSRIVKPEYIQKTHDFYEKYGNKTIVLQRSGALQVVDAPQSVHRSGLTNCLRQAFESSQTPLPKEASIRVQEK